MGICWGLWIARQQSVFNPAPLGLKTFLKNFYSCLTWIQQRGRREDHQISMESMVWFQDHFAGDQCGIPSNRGFPVKSMHGQFSSLPVDPVVYHFWVVQFDLGLTSGITTTNAFLLGHQGTNLSTSGETGAY